MKKTTILSCLLTLVAVMLVLNACNNGQPTKTITTTITLAPGNPSSTITETLPVSSSTAYPTFKPGETPTSTLPTTPPPGAPQVLLADQGIIVLDHYYYYQRIYGSISEPVSYRGVIFSPKDWGNVTPTGPIAFWYIVTFADGTQEDLNYVGFTNEGQMIYSFTKHDNLRAGVLFMAAKTGGGSLQPVFYLLVSE